LYYLFPTIYRFSDVFCFLRCLDFGNDLQVKSTPLFSFGRLLRAFKPPRIAFTISELSNFFQNMSLVLRRPKRIFPLPSWKQVFEYIVTCAKLKFGPLGQAYFEVLSFFSWVRCQAVVALRDIWFSKNLMRLADSFCVR